MNKRKFFVSFFVTLLVACLLLLILAFGYYSFVLKGQNVGEEVGEEVMEVLDVVEDEHSRQNVLVIGVDKSGILADVMMIFSFSNSGEPINLMSVQRDTVVRVNGSAQKINSVLRYGDEDLISAVKEVTGIPIHDYVRVNFKAVETIVDELGGVEFDVPQNMNYDDPEQDLHIHLQAGPQLLNGEKALQLLRFRGYPMADIQRTKVQRDFIWEMFRQKVTLGNIDKIDEVYDAVQEHLRSNITYDDLLEYANMANGCELQTFAMPYEISNAIAGAVTVKEGEMQALAEAHFMEEK